MLERPEGYATWPREMQDEWYHFNAQGNGEAASAAVVSARATKGGAFLKAYRPLSYGYVYGLTARRSTGKTAYFIIVTCDKIKAGRRVAYVTKENPDDFRMKLAANCYIHGIDHALADEMLLVLDDRTDSPEAICEMLRIDGAEYGQFDLIFYDTFQAGFSSAGGDDFNNNAAVLKFLERFRPMAELTGNPGVLIAFRPTKNAGEEELFPFGGGSIMNELDGNLTLWTEASYEVKLHQNRVRGPEFEPQYFKLDKISCPDIVDINGAQILLPFMKPTSADDVEDRRNQEGNLDLALLKAMIANPDGSQREWGLAVGKDVSRVNRKLQSLKERKFVETALGGKWRVTSKGMKEAAQ